jgi:hypothetical protein
MKIYCILFDTVPQGDKIKNLFESKNLHYSDYITNSWTATTLMSMFSGKTPTEVCKEGVGYKKLYPSFSDREKKAWNKKIIFNQLPEDWKIHIHSMSKTRGDKEDFRFVPDEICGIDRDVNYYDYQRGEDEEKFIQKMQKLSSDENHFIFLKYNHYHNQMQEGTIDNFCKIINTINFEEENSLFWVFSDHGHPTQIDKFMSPPHSWLTWVSVTDNIKNNKVDKKIIYNLDFYNTIMNRIYDDQTVPDGWYWRLPKDDILSKFDKNRIYVSEDGRSDIDSSRCTTVSAMKYLGEDKYLQTSYHKPENNTRSVIYNKNNSSYDLVDNDNQLLNHLKSGIWRWYFENE